MTTAAAPIAASPPEEDYIDMELSSSPSSNYFCYSLESPPLATRDFEFQIQMTSFPGETEPTTSPADDLFYKGKLLPLHLPPRLQMVQKLIHSQNPSRNNESFQQNYQIPLIAIKAPPHEFCDFSPTESCRPSCELNQDEYLLGFRREEQQDPSRKSWSKKVKQLKQSSQAYFKALFGKSAKSEETETIFENRGSSGKFIKRSKKPPFGRIDYNKWSEREKSEEFYHRRSFSGAISSTINNKCSSGSSCSSTSSSGSSSLSSSFSFSSKGFSDLQLFKRSISANSEIESSIEGAIAHCKQSQKKFDNSRKNEVESHKETCSISASKVLGCGVQKSSNLCRI